MRKLIPKLIIYQNNTIIIPTIGEINPDYPDSYFKPTCLTDQAVVEKISISSRWSNSKMHLI